MKGSIRCAWLLMLALALGAFAWGQESSSSQPAGTAASSAAPAKTARVVEVDSDVPADQQASREQILSMIDATGGKKVGDQMMNSMMGSIWNMAVGKYKESHPNATPEQLAKLKKVFDIPFPVTMQDIYDIMIPIYQKLFTRDEVLALTAFYNTPVGKSFMAKTPVLMQKMMPAMMNIATDGRMTEWGKQIAARMEAFDKEYPDKTAKPAAHKHAAN